MENKKPGPLSTFALVVVSACVIGGIMFYVNQGNKGMERAANDVGTTTRKIDTNAAANQGSTYNNSTAIDEGRTK